MKTIKIVIANAALCFFVMPIAAMELRNGKVSNQGQQQAVSRSLNNLSRYLENLLNRTEIGDIDLTTEYLSTFEEVGQTLGDIEATNEHGHLHLENQIIDAYAMLYVLSSIAEENIENPVITLPLPQLEVSDHSSEEDFGILTKDEAELFGLCPHQASSNAQPPISRLFQEDIHPNLHTAKTPELAVSDEPSNLALQLLTSIHNENKEPAQFISRQLHRNNAYIDPRLLQTDVVSAPSVWNRVKEVARYLCCCRKRQAQD